MLSNSNKKIQELNITSKSSGKSAVVILGKNLNIGEINYTEELPANKKNELIQKLNLTGCVNIYDLNFKIDEYSVDLFS